MDKSFDRNVVISGASSGIGAACARQIVAAGGRVALGARRADRLERLVEELGDAAVAVAADVSKPADCKLLIDTAVERFGQVDAVVANAGIGMYGGILDHSDTAIAEMLETNIGGTVWLTRAAVPELLRHESSDIVIVSSVAGTHARENEAVYAATKHAQMGLGGGLDRELSKKGVRVTMFCPGGVVTEFAMGEGRGRTPESPQLSDMMTADHAAEAIVHIMSQPRAVRTLVYRLRGVTEED